jgi:glycosyltransferase involved in cell wall biosynthesis
MTWARQDYPAFFREWGYNYGLDGLARAREILNGRESLCPDEPLNRRLIDLSLSLIVHSEFVRRQILATHPNAAVDRIPMPCSSRQSGSTTCCEARRELGLEEEGCYIGSFGFLAPSKQVELLLDVFGDALLRFPAARLLFVGEPLSWYDPMPLIEQRGLEDKVTVTGYLPLSKWYTYMKAVDVAVNLRYPTLGETSASVLRLLGEGVPTIVSKVGWYAELPDECVVKVEVGESMRADLRMAVTGLLDDQERLVQLGRTAQDYVATHHNVQEVARAYVNVLEKFVHRFAW